MSFSDRTARAAAEPDTVLGNLPVPLTKLLGRESVLAELRSLLRRTRLLTVCGPGGAGKSRLGIALAEAVRADFNGGVWWADLSSSVDPSLVAQAVAAAILPGGQASNPAAAIARQLNAASLLVLDNCDQVVAGCAEFVIDLLASAPAVRIVVTSRQAVGVPGEQHYRASGLMVESSESTSGNSGAADTADGGAIPLFMQRAQEAAGTFTPDARDTRVAVAQICRWLDGMPLAIELAAARVAVLSVTQIAERLTRDSNLLRQTGRGAPGRHRTLQDTLEWSHQLLEAPERRLFRRLGAFRSSFTLAAAEAIGADELLAADDVLDLLSMLINHSLVQVLDGPDQPRYRLLATVRQYAIGKLESSGELDATLERHAQFFAALGHEARAGLAGAELIRWLERLELEHDNLSEALQWLFAHAPAQAAELASGLWPFSYQHGYYSEARTWFERALNCDELSTAARIDALLKAGEVAFLQCEYPVAINYLQTALELIGEAGDRRAQAIALQLLGSIAREQGRYEQSRGLHEQSMAIWKALADREGVASSQNYLGFVAWLAGEFELAEAIGLEALAEFRRTGNLRDVATTLISLGAAALYRGESELAAERLEEALAISRRLGFQEGIAWSLHELAILTRRRRRPSRELEMMLRDALLVHQQLGDRWRAASVLEEIAGSVLVRQDPALAVQVLAGSQALRELIGTAIPPVEAPDRDAALSRLRRKLSAVAFEQAWAQGCAQEPREAIAMAVRAIEELADHDAPGASAEKMAPILTPRELAVLELLAQGHTNREIAAALYISPSTAGVHVSNILRKLRAKRRVDAAGLAHTLGLIPTH